VKHYKRYSHQIFQHNTVISFGVYPHTYDGNGTGMIWRLLQAAKQCPLLFIFSVLLVLVLVLVLIFGQIRQPVIAHITRLKAVSTNLFPISTVLTSNLYFLCILGDPCAVNLFFVIVLKRICKIVCTTPLETT